MDTIYSYFLSGLMDRASVDVVTLFVIVIMIKYPISRYIKIIYLCAVFSLCVMAGMAMGCCGVLPSRTLIETMMIIAILIPAFLGIFAASPTPSRTMEKISVIVVILAGLSYGMMEYPMIKKEVWVAIPSYAVGEMCGCILLSVVVCIVAKIIELLSMTRRDIVMVGSAVVMGMYAGEVWRFLCKLFS